MKVQAIIGRNSDLKLVFNRDCLTMTVLYRNRKLYACKYYNEVEFYCAQHAAKHCARNNDIESLNKLSGLGQKI